MAAPFPRFGNIGRVTTENITLDDRQPDAGDPQTRSRRSVVLCFFLAAFAAFVPVRSYDAFWHLATGRWIVDHRALPLRDPFAIASDRHEWINGEWLFQVAAWAIESLGGIAALSWARALMAAALFTLAFLYARRESEEGNALLLTAIAFAGAAPTLDFRPSGVAPLFVVLVLATRRTSLYVLLTAVWMNIHPSALLAPLIGAVRASPLEKDGSWRRAIATGAASAAALLLNPYGLRGVTAPLELMAFVGSGAFVNAEWLPSPIAAYPILYLSLTIAVVVFLTAGTGARQPARIALMLLFAWLAIRHVRHQPLFFAALPLLVAPSIRRGLVPQRIAKGAGFAIITLLLLFSDHRSGVLPERFPVDAVARLKATGLRGNIYNPDQFGGYLIWSFYPERRTLTDGRNELHRTFIPEYARARADERAWHALLQKYRIDLAVEEYAAPLTVTDAVSGRKSTLPASLAYWPRDEWALIGYDDAAMVFARRAAFGAEELGRWELKGVVPDAPVSSPSRER